MKDSVLKAVDILECRREVSGVIVRGAVVGTVNVVDVGTNGSKLNWTKG